MAKHPVPKQKQSKARSKKRYGAFATDAKKKIVKRVQLTVCPKCKEKKMTHHVCPTCGTYKGREVINMNKTAKKVQTIKA